MNKELDHPNWRFATSILSRVRPGSTGFDPDGISGIHPKAWLPLDRADKSDEEIAAYLWGLVGPLDSEFIVAVTFASYLRHVGPFFLTSSGLNELVASHAELFLDPFFSADTTIVDAINGRIIVVHHDDLVANVEGDSAVEYRHRRSLM